MDPVRAPYPERLRTRMSEEAFRARLAELDREFDGLLDPEALTLLALDEAGVPPVPPVRIADLPALEEATLEARVAHAGSPRTFARERGPPGRVATLLLEDDTGSVPLVLWDRALGPLDDGVLRPGARVRVMGARVKRSDRGLELHTTPWTALEVEGAPSAAARKLQQDVAPETAPFQSAARLVPGTYGNDLRLRVVTVAVPRSFQRADGTGGTLLHLETVDADAPERTPVPLVAWDEAATALSAVAPGHVLELRDAAVKERNGRVEVHTTRRTRITRSA